MKLSKLAISLFLGVGAVCAATSMAHAVNEVVFADGVYVNGGAAKEDQAYFEENAKKFNLRLKFLKDDAPVSKVRLIIADQNFDTVLFVQSAGPLTSVMLPDGQYRVSATLENGKTEKQVVNLSRSQAANISVSWKD
jgi:hypothetical protein